MGYFVTERGGSLALRSSVEMEPLVLLLFNN